MSLGDDNHLPSSDVAARMCGQFTLKKACTALYDCYMQVELGHLFTQE